MAAKRSHPHLATVSSPISSPESAPFQSIDIRNQVIRESKFIRFSENRRDGVVMWVSVKREVQRAKQHVGGQWSKLEEKENPLGGGRRRRRRKSWGLRGSRMNQAAAEWVEIIEPRTKVSADGFKVISASSLLSVFYQDHPHKDHPHQDHLEHQDHRSQGANIHCELQNCSCTHDPPVRKSLQVEAIHIMDCRLPIEIHLNTPRYWQYYCSLQNVTDTRGIGSWDPMNL